jgi:hypothetical protein
MRLLTKTQRRKHAEKQGFWRNCDLVQSPMILQDQTNKRSTPKHKNEKHRPCPARQQRNTFHTCHDSIGKAVAICYMSVSQMGVSNSDAYAPGQAERGRRTFPQPEACSVQSAARPVPRPAACHENCGGPPTKEGRPFLGGF